MSDDLISKQEAIHALGYRPLVWGMNDPYSFGAQKQYDKDRLAIEALPPVQRKTGKWIDDTYCSECGWANEVESGFIGSVKGFKFCPKCGAEMKKEKE